MRKKLNKLLTAGIWLLAAGALAQMGGIRGMVMDADFEVPLPGVKILVSETGREAVSGDAGSYVLEQVPPGAYTLMFSKPGYTRVTKSQVVVLSGQLSEADAALTGEYEEMDELVVKEISLGGASEIGLLNLRMESSALMDSVGADLMSKAGASDAAQALTLVPGTTVQDGKYAVVRGLPDRYVSSQMNSVRLPTADPDKRAVQLDQFPSAMIDSVQVSKTFTPDQQGDASGGAVNIVLKGIPDERILKFSAGSKYKTSVGDAGSGFLQDAGVSVSTWGHDADDVEPQDLDTPWSGELGVSRGRSQAVYDWSITAGDKVEIGSDLKVGFIGSLFYKRDASHEEGTDDKYWLVYDETYFNGYTDRLYPYYSGNAWRSYDADGDDEREAVPRWGEEVNTSLFDYEESAEELQWGVLGGIGAETEDHSLTLLYSYNFSSESTARIAEDTRGKEYFFDGYDPDDPTSPGGADSDWPRSGSDYSLYAPYRRTETLDYTERTAGSLQLRGTHTAAVGEHSIGSFITFMEPEIDWTAAWSSSTMDTPDRRSLETYWLVDEDGTAKHYLYYDDGNLARLVRKWREVEEESFQYFANLNLPFTLWNEEEGFAKAGIFSDQVDRSYDENTFYTTDTMSYEGGWEELWSEYLSTQSITMQDYPHDVSYDGEQDISAWYLMAEIPAASFLKLTGGVRFEQTDISTLMRDIDADAQLYIESNGYGPLDFVGNEEAAQADINQCDVLPSIGFELRPFEKAAVRGSYTETIARMTFKELVPIQQVDSIGDDIFIGNPDLQMSSLRNYDLRFDYHPYPGGLVSASWFMKEMKDVIDYRQVLLGGSTLATTAANYDEGSMNGFEVEVRQAMGEWWEPLEGLDLGANLTLIDAEVDAAGTEIDDLLAAGLDEIVEAEYDDGKRDMMGTPEYLYNLNATYTIPKVNTELGLFYTVKGDALKAAGTQENGNYFPHVYEKSYGTLNFSLSQRLGEHFKLSFKVKNILDPDIETVYRSNYTSEEVAKTSYRKGVEYSAGISGNW